MTGLPVQRGIRRLPIRRKIVKKLRTLCDTLDLDEPRITRGMLSHHHYVLDGFTAPLVIDMGSTTKKNVYYRSVTATAYQELVQKTIEFDLRLVDATAFILRENMIALKIMPQNFPDLLLKRKSCSLCLDDALWVDLNDDLKAVRMHYGYVSRISYLEHVFRDLTIEDMVNIMANKVNVFEYAAQPVTYSTMNVPYKVYYAVTLFSNDTNHPKWASFSALMKDTLTELDRPVLYLNPEITTLMEFRELAMKVIDPEGILFGDKETQKEKA